MLDCAIVKLQQLCSYEGSTDVISKVKFTNAVVSFLLSLIDFKSKLNDVHYTCPGPSLDKVRNIQSNATR